MEAASLKARKLAKAAKKAAGLAVPEKLDQPTATQQKASGISRGKGKGLGEHGVIPDWSEECAILPRQLQKTVAENYTKA